MDTEAQHTERDRSSSPFPSGSPDGAQENEERSLPSFQGQSCPSIEEQRIEEQRIEEQRIEEQSSPSQEERVRPSFQTWAAAWLPGGRAGPTVVACLAFLAVLVLGTVFVAQPFQVPSGSMEPGLRVGDRILVNKLAYRFGNEPRRGDVVVFDGAATFGAGDFVKRVVGAGGDRVVCCDREGRIEVNGRPVDESEILHPGDRPSGVPFDVVVPDGRLFVLGDHRSDSSDSRDRLGSPGGGMVPVDDVIGRADWIIWPAGHWSHLVRPGAYAHLPAADGGHG